MLYFKKRGYQVISLSQREGVDLNPYLKSQGIPAYSHIIPREGGFLFFLRHLVFFVQFCYVNKVDVVFSHLDSANFVASMGQYLINAKVFLCRHHVDEAALYEYHLTLSYRLTNKLSKKVIVVSEAARRYMIEHEQMRPEKLIHINLAYDFDLFQIPKAEQVKELRNQFRTRLVLITICRLTRYKRPDFSIKLVEHLRKAGVDAHVIILGSGEMREELELMVQRSGLENYVTMPGHVGNVLTYMAVADFIIHPSVLESSCVAVKEAGIMKKPVVVCSGVGDFDEYIEHGKNGFLISKTSFVEEAHKIIIENMYNPTMLKALGESLYLTVNRLFDIRNIAPQYERLIN
jgi:glycosyltransferase involved in cell wall biosynthesis